MAAKRRHEDSESRASDRAAHSKKERETIGNQKDVHKLSRQRTEGTDTGTPVGSVGRLEEQVINVRGQQKPSFALPPTSAHALKGRLQAFLPTLAKSNEVLLKENAGDMENIEAGKPYIELNLGLGVLEHQSNNDGSSDEEETMKSQFSSHNKSAYRADEEEDTLQHLMGKTPRTKHEGVEEVG